jgi:hypothetical protein
MAWSLNKRATTILSASVWLMTTASGPAHADRVGYYKVIDLWTETSAVRAEHHHDWGKATRDEGWEIFGTGNDYSYLRLVDRATGAELFRRPVPALTHIWISPNSKYVVGISNVMARNPYQLVVFGRSGDRLLERNMVGVYWPGVTRTVTNWIYWYKEPVPQMTIVEDGTIATLSIEDPLGVLRQFELPAIH